MPYITHFQILLCVLSNIVMGDDCQKNHHGFLKLIEQRSIKLSLKKIYFKYLLFF